MIISMCGENQKLMDEKRNDLLYMESGELKTEYDKITKTYRITKLDGSEFLGDEKIEVKMLGEYKGPSTLDEIIEHEINLFVLLQVCPESNLFDEFYYSITEDKKTVLVEPIYKNDLNIEMIIPNENPLFSGISLIKHRNGIRKYSKLI